MKDGEATQVVSTCTCISLVNSCMKPPMIKLNVYNNKTKRYSQIMLVERERERRKARTVELYQIETRPLH